MAEEHALITVAGQPLEIVSLDATEHVSELFRLELVCRGPAEPPSPRSLIAAEAALTLRDSFGVTRDIKGLIAEVSSRHHDDGSSIFRLVMVPVAYMLSLGSSCRAFLDKTVVDIVTEVLGAGGIAHRWELGSSYAMRVYCVQYREDDWTFINRLLEQEGIYYWFDHSAGSVMVLSDDSTSAPDLDGGALIPFHYEAGLTAASEMIEQLGATAAVVPNKFSIKSFSPDNPALDVSGTTGDGALEYYDAPGGGPDSPGECARQARLLREGAAAEAAGVSGQGTSVRLIPGRVFEVENHPVAPMDRRYFCTGIRYRVRQRRRGAAGSDERAFVMWFTGIDATVPYRPPRDTTPAQQAGLQSGMVIGPGGAEIYPNAKGEVRIQQHWDREGARDDRSGKWMRVAQRGTHDSLLLPRIGWNVLTFNDEGAIDTPSVLSRIHDAEHPPAYPLPANKTRVVFKTATSPADGTSNEIYFEDKKGAEEVFINASKDWTLLTQNASEDTVEHDSLRTVGNNHTLTVETDLTEVVKNDQTTTIGGNLTQIIGGSYQRTVLGNETISVGGNRVLTTAANHSITAESTRSVSVGSAIIDTSLGTIAADSDKLSITVGGAHVKASTKGITEDAGWVSIQTVGGAKLELCKANRALDVKKHYLETVGGLILSKTDTKYTDGATNNATWTVGALMKGKAPEIMLEAVDKITLKCGGSKLTLTPDSIEFVADSFDLTKASHIESITKKIEHN